MGPVSAGVNTPPIEIRKRGEMESRVGLLQELHLAASTGILDAELFANLPHDPASIHECEVLDFKQQLPVDDSEYVKTMRDLVAMHNSYGGFLVFGIAEIEKDRGFSLVGVPPNSLKIAKLRDYVLSYSGSDIRLQPISLDVGDLRLEVIWVEKRTSGQRPLRFAKNGPESKPGKPIFKRNDVVFRRIESNAIAQNPEDYDFLFSERRLASLALANPVSPIIQPLEHNLPDRAFICSTFFGRTDDIGDLWAWLEDDFSRVRLIAGEGGLGKTSLAYQFAEDVATRRTQPFTKVVWLTAKERQFIAWKDDYVEASCIDFSDADSLFCAVGKALACVDDDFVGLNTKERMLLALEACTVVPTFIVIDDVDSLTPADQLRALEFGLRSAGGTKILLTTRVNFSYSPDNVLKLDGLPKQEFLEYVESLRERYLLVPVTDARIEKLRDVTGGSPLFTDSLLRLERRGIPLDKAMEQWKGEKGLEVRKAALAREILQLSREAKRVLFVICTLRNCSYVELSQVLDYADQTLGDALQELSGLFLISAPAIAREARYTVEPNTRLLVLASTNTLGIDHAALVAATKSSKADAVGLTLQKRSNIVGLAISDAVARVKNNDPKGALEVVTAASKKLSNPHPDLLLATGRFNLALAQPNYEDAKNAFAESYRLGQRKPLLFDLWFEVESRRGSFDDARDVATKAIDCGLLSPRWYERRAQAYVALSNRGKSRFSNDTAIRELDLAVADLRTAKALSTGDILRKHFETLLLQAEAFRRQLLGR